MANDKKIGKILKTSQKDALDEEYDEIELLERLESLREDMEDLGIRTLDDLIKRINDLHRRLDDQ